jgi:hypothetical protein
MEDALRKMKIMWVGNNKSSAKQKLCELGTTNEFDLNFSRERDFEANEAFSNKTRKQTPRMAGLSVPKKWQ